MPIPYFLLIVVLLLSGCNKEATNTGGGLETETVSNIKGIIVDKDDNFVDKARVIATKSDGDLVLTEDTSYTDNEGIYLFKDLDSGTYELNAEKIIDNIPYTALIGSVYNDCTDIFVGRDTLLATGYIAGNVITEDTKSSYLGIDIYVPGTSFSAHSDSSGNFVMSYVALGKHIVAFDEPGYEIKTTTATIQNPGDTAWLDSIVLIESITPEHFKIKGSYSFATGHSIESLTVTIDKLDDADSIVSTHFMNLDSLGGYLYSKGTPGKYRFSFTDTIEGFRYSHSFTKEFLYSYDTTLPQVTLRPENGHVSGVALRADSTYHEFIKVELLGTNRTEKTAPNGNYYFEAVPKGNHTLRFTSYKYDTTYMQFTQDLNADTILIDSVTLPKTPTKFIVDGLLVFPDGEIVYGAKVLFQERNSQDSIISEKKTYSNIRGEYQYDPVYPGTYTLIADIKHNDTSYILEKRLTFNNIKDTILGPDTMRIYDPQRGAVKGRCTKEGDLTHHNILIKIDETIYSARTDSMGYFLIDNMPFGTYDLKCSYSGFIIQSKEFSITDSYDTLDVGHIRLPKVVEASIPMKNFEDIMFHDIHLNMVSVSSFSIGLTEISVEQYKKFNPTWSNHSGTGKDTEPVAGLSLSEAIQYCNWLSIQEGLDTCYVINKETQATRVYGDSLYWEYRSGRNGYRLPTGDEWEAAAIGNQLDYYHYATDDGTIKVGPNPQESNLWAPPVSENSVQPVSKFGTNWNGLYDLQGNVWEYTWDNSSNSNKGSRSDFAVPDADMNGHHTPLRGGAAVTPSGHFYSDKSIISPKVNSLDDPNLHDYFSNESRGFRIAKNR